MHLSPSIQIQTKRRDCGRFSAIVVLNGEHDLSTREALRVAFAQLEGTLLVDLGLCSFIDASVIGVLLGNARRLARIVHQAGRRARLTAGDWHRCGGV
jgi:anti-anti-sigma regulatory factor